MSGRLGQLVVEIFVNNTDLIHLDMRSIKSMEEAHSRFQDSVTSWGELLIATGGALKPIKCSYYMISFKWNSYGQWSYEANETKESFAILVPLSNGPPEEIQHLPINEAVKTLGSMTCPSGSNLAGLERMQSQGQEWADRVNSGRISRRNMWTMMERQLWPQLGMGSATTLQNETTSRSAFGRYTTRSYQKGE
jgi:hypothetical protein